MRFFQRIVVLDDIRFSKLPRWKILVCTCQWLISDFSNVPLALCTPQLVASPFPAHTTSCATSQTSSSQSRALPSQTHLHFWNGSTGSAQHILETTALQTVLQVHPTSNYFSTNWFCLSPTHSPHFRNGLHTTRDVKVFIWHLPHNRSTTDGSNALKHMASMSHRTDNQCFGSIMPLSSPRTHPHTSPQLANFLPLLNMDKSSFTQLTLFCSGHTAQIRPHPSDSAPHHPRVP